MNGQEIKAALQQGKRVYGTMVASTSPKWLKHIVKTGLDFVFIDTEHTAIGRETLSWMCYAYGASGMAPIVRIPSPDPYLAAAVLDGGACGVLAPYIETVDQVKALAGAVKYKPVKGKKLADKLDGKADFEPGLAAYIAYANREAVLLINIESVAAVEVLDELLGVPGLDGVVIGPHDLSCSLGIPEQYDHPLFEEAVRDILRRCRRRELGAGIHFMGGADKLISWAREAGLNLIIHSADLNLFTETLQKDLDRIKAA